MTFNKIAFAIGASALLTLSACTEKNTAIDLVHEDAVPHAQLGGNVIPSAYRLDLVINPDDAAFKGVVEIDVDIKAPTDKIWLHGKHMTVTGAAAIWPDGASEPLMFTELSESEAPSGIAFLSAEKPLPVGKTTLRLPYTTPFNTALNSAYKVERDGEAYIVTQFEAIGAREAFPSFDEPRFKVPFSLSISAPKEDFVYANTPEVKTEDIGGDWEKHVFQQTRPLPTYLLAFGVGPYDVTEYDPLPPTDVRSRSVPLRGIAARGSGDQMEYALKNTAGILEALEAYFGIPYPYEKLDLIAAPDYAFGAMENPGAIVYREYLLLMNEGSALSQKRAYAGVHSHELAHQWFGNLVTPYWWEDIWLNEAFATWMGNKGTHLWQPEGNFNRKTLNASLGAMNIDTLSTTRKVREPLERTEQVMDQFDGITYRKGGGVLDMFESYLGEEAFQKGVRLHMKRYADDVATADDFFQSIADGSGDATVVNAMKSFVDQPGLPLVSVEMDCTERSCRTDFHQSRYAPLGSNTKQGQSWQIPVCAKYIFAGGDTSKQCRLVTDSEFTEKVTFDAQPIAVMPNENGAGYYRFSLGADVWKSLLGSLDKLNTREVLAVQDSLTAAFRAGQVDASVYLKGIEAFAAHPEYDVAANAGDLLGWMHDDLSASSRADLSRLIQDMFADRYEKVVGKDTVDGNLLAPTLARNLIFKANDAAMLSAYAAQGAAYLGLDGEPDKTAVAPNMLGNALRAVMKTRSKEAYAPLMAMVKGGSSFEKGAAIGGLSATTDQALAAKTREAALSDKDTFTGRQATSLISSMIGNIDHRDATWDWFKANFDAYVSTRIPDVRIGGVPGYGRGFCTLEKRDEVKAFFESKAALIPGSERSLKQTVERIELCAALTEDKGVEMATALSER
ncbi:MAG: M1 family metallopeptidase [Alphaproteobacteria bacterium]